MSVLIEQTKCGIKTMQSRIENVNQPLHRVVAWDPDKSSFLQSEEYTSKDIINFMDALCRAIQKSYEIVMNNTPGVHAEIYTVILTAPVTTSALLCIFDIEKKPTNQRFIEKFFNNELFTYLMIQSGI